MIHELKIWPEYFRDVRAGIKTAEIRLNDRNYKEGDVLILKEYDPVADEFTGKEELRSITNVLADVRYLQPGMVMLSMSGGMAADIENHRLERIIDYVKSHAKREYECNRDNEMGDAYDDILDQFKKIEQVTKRVHQKG